MRTTEIELLAPAGNKASLHAAVVGGADAVYLGVEGFNARRSADNFTLDTLSDACEYAHMRGVKVYLTLNTVILPNEVPVVLETARQAYRRGVDAFIVQDIGLISELQRILPVCPIHTSTQMNIHNIAGIQAAVRPRCEARDARARTLFGRSHTTERNGCWLWRGDRSVCSRRLYVFATRVSVSFLL